MRDEEYLQPIETTPKDGTYSIVWPPPRSGVTSCARVDGLRPGDRIIEGQYRVRVVDDIRYLRDGKVHVDTDDGAGTTIYECGDMVWVTQP